MVIDTSAIIAILQDEPERQAFNQLIAAAPHRFLSAVSLVEISIVIESRFGSEGKGDLDLFLQTAAVETISVNREQADLARDAFHRFGRGRHPAALNFGDCFSYALAKWTDSPLLFKGNDFVFTDLQPAFKSMADEDPQIN